MDAKLSRWTYQPYRKSRHEESKKHIKYLVNNSSINCVQSPNSNAGRETDKEL